MTDYTYSKNSDFNSHACAVDLLKLEIEASDIEKTCGSVTMADDTVTVSFSSALSAPEIIILEDIIHTHKAYTALVCKQIKCIILEENTETASESYGDLLAQKIISLGGELILQASYSVTVTDDDTQVHFQITVDDVTKCGSIADPPGSDRWESGSIATKVSIDKGVHVIKLRWKVSKGTAKIRPETQPNEHATIIVTEI